MLNTEFSSWPHYTQEEADAVSSVLLSNKVNYWTGELGRKFEQEFANWCGCEYAIALANGTLALELILTALDIGPGDEVIVTPRTFLASASCVISRGATPVFADVDLYNQNLSADTISHCITDKTKAVIVVHLAGMPADMDPIMELAAKHNFYVIEDCAQAHGAKYKGRHVGTIGDAGAWSFCQDKIMTTGGEGGMVTTNNQSLWRKMWSFKDHGKSFDKVFNYEHPPGYRWLHDSFGSNYRMTEMQAAIGLIQLRKMSEWTAMRHQNATVLRETLSRYAFLRLESFDESVVEHAYYKFYAFVLTDVLPEGWSRDKIISALNEKAVPCLQGSCSEVYLEAAFDNGYRPEKRLPNAQLLGETSLMFLVHPTLTSDEMAEICRRISLVLDSVEK